MTEQNTAMMREVFIWLSKHETVPAGYDEAWWKSFVQGASDIYNRYTNKLTFHLLAGIIDGQNAQHMLDEGKRVGGGE